MPRPRHALLAGAAVAAATLCLSPIASAQQTQDGLALAQAKVCLACHQVDARRVGPPFREMAKRYANPDVPHEGLQTYLALTIRQGSRGKWGALVMPAQPQVSEAEARELADWILSLKP